LTAQEPAASATLETRVKLALVDEPAVDAAAVFVEATGGQVRLSGFADSDAQRRRAVDTARGVAGVTSVESRIRMR
jgi:osmotically-inducible protein OsmY